MQHNSSQPKRCPVSRAVTIYAALFFCLLQLVSCTPSSRIVEASFDLANEHEGGPSTLRNGDAVGYNVTLEYLWGLAGVSHSNSAGDGVRSKEVTSAESLEMPAPVAAGNWMFGSSLQLIRKGSKFEDATTHLQYLEVLGDVIYQYPMKDGGTLFGGAGPYIGYGIGGNVKAGGTKMSAFGGTDGYKRFDAGLHLTAGYALASTLQFSLGYEFGLVNKSPEPDFTSKNRTLSVNVGYSLTRIISGFRKK